MSDGQATEVKVQERFRGPALFFWFLLVVLFSTFLALSAFGIALAIIGATTRHGSPADLGKLVGMLLTFDRAKIGAFLDGSMVAGGTLVSVVCGVLAIVIALFQRSIERVRTNRLTVTPLLPGAKYRFVPCEEGIYAQWFRNIYTGSIWYSFHPWSTLILDTVDDAHRRVTVRAGKTTFFLRARALPGDQTDYYQSLKQVVLSRLPEAGRVPQPKKLHFNWAACLAMIVLAVLISSAGLHYLDTRATGRFGDSRCDVCSSNLGWGFYQVRAGNRPVQEYCELHGYIYAAVHPGVALRSLARDVPAITRQKGFAQAVAAGNTNITGLITWWTYGCIILIIASPKPRILDR